MNHLKTNPVGIDKVIDRIQKSIYAPLVTSWTAVDIYGRVYPNHKRKGIELEVYNSNGNYDPILFNEGNKVFFVSGREPENNAGGLENDLWAIATVNLDKVKAGITHRADEEVRGELFQLLIKALDRDSIVRIEWGMDKIKRIVEDTLSFDDLNVSDLHPYHVFAIRMRVKYSIIVNEC